MEVGSSESQALHHKRQVALEAVEKNWRALDRDVDPEFKGDKEVVLKALEQSGCAIRLASLDLRGDKEVVLEAVRQDGEVLQYASEGLRADREVVLAAVRKHGGALQYAHEGLRADKEVVLEAMRKGGVGLQYASHELRADKEVVLEALNGHRMTLQFASDNLWTDKEVVMIAVEVNGQSLRYASEKLQSDKEVVLRAVQNEGEALLYAGTELKADRDVVLAAVQRTPLSIRHAEALAQIDKDLVLLALRLDPKVAEIAGFKAMVEGLQLSETCRSTIAVQGEAAPIVTVTLTRNENDSGFHCEASLMSGVSFSCEIEDYSFFDRWVIKRRSEVILNDLAVKLVDLLPTCTEVKGAQRIFINFTQGDVADALAVTPWDWDRPLADFLLGF